jgi:hypothetical protein
MKRLLFLIVGLFILSACIDQTIKDIAKESKSPAFTINSFKEIPIEIEGCSCLFSESKTEYTKKEYLFAASYDSAGFVSVDRKLIKLKLISTERDPGTFGDYDHKNIYQGSGYTVTVDIHYKNSTGEEVWWNDGTITIRNTKGQQKSQKFVGECGC